MPLSESPLAEPGAPSDACGPCFGPTDSRAIRFAGRLWGLSEAPEGLNVVIAFGNLDQSIGGYILEGLGGPTRGPGDREAIDSGRFEQAQTLNQGVAAKAAVVADRAMDHPRR